MIQSNRNETFFRVPEFEKLRSNEKDDSDISHNQKSIERALSIALSL